MTSKVFFSGLFFLALCVVYLSLSRHTISYGATPPTVNSTTIAVTSGGSAASSFIPTEGTTRTIYIHGNITDPDGCEDVATTTGSVVAKFYRTNHASSSSCSNDNNDCYSIANADCSKTGCTGPGDNDFNYECTAPIWYYADTTLAGSQSSTNWTTKITATDTSALSGNGTSTVEIFSLVGLDIPSSIAYGTLTSNEQSNEQTNTITNTGNSGIDVNISVNGDMTCSSSGLIDASNVRYSTSSGFNYDTASSTATTEQETELDLSPRTNDAASSTKDIYFKLKTPTSGAGGACSNTLIITAKVDQENGW